jgi:major membrane immunogen (membrane-anchored lipoprotein)
LNIEDYITDGRTVQDKLKSLGTTIVERGIENLVGVIRGTIAESQRFPNLSCHVHEASRNRAAAAVSELLNDATHALARQSKEAFSPKR